MTKDELEDRIRSLAPQAYANVLKAEQTALEYDELTKFPELKKVIVSLLSTDYAKFIDDIDWVSPKPTTFRINFLNGESFYLTYTDRSWVAEIEGKKYYLINLPEEDLATMAISRILRFGVKGPSKEEDEEVDTEAPKLDNKPPSNSSPSPNSNSGLNFDSEPEPEPEPGPEDEEI